MPVTSLLLCVIIILSCRNKTRFEYSNATRHFTISVDINRYGKGLLTTRMTGFDVVIALGRLDDVCILSNLRLTKKCLTLNGKCYTS